MFSIQAQTEMPPLSSRARPSELLQRCRGKLSDLVSHPDPNLRVLVGHSNMLDILISSLDVDYPRHPAHSNFSEYGDQDRDVAEYDDSVASLSDSDLESDSDSDDGYELYMRHGVLSVRNPDPPSDTTCSSDIDLKPPNAPLDEENTTDFRTIELKAGKESFSLDQPVLVAPKTDHQKMRQDRHRFVWWRQSSSFQSRCQN